MYEEYRVHHVAIGTRNLDLMKSLHRGGSEEAGQPERVTT